MSKEEIIIMWAKGYYKLGWRGLLAEKLLRPYLLTPTTQQ